MCGARSSVFPADAADASDELELLGRRELRLRVERGVHATVGQHDRGMSWMYLETIFASADPSSVYLGPCGSSSYGWRTRSGPRRRMPILTMTRRRSGLVYVWAQNGKTLGKINSNKTGFTRQRYTIFVRGRGGRVDDVHTILRSMTQNRIL